MKRVLIVGLGLIGGSIGQALRRESPAIELFGIDTQHVLQQTELHRLLDRAFATEALNRASLRELDADLVVLAVPVGAIIASIGDWLELGVPLTDCGSTKTAIVAAAQGYAGRHSFVPGHPMAGRERGGFESASPELFRARRWIVCPNGASSTALGVVQQLVTTVGAVWTEMTPEAHDAAVAMTSHLPQLVASWLEASTGEQQREAAGPAFMDMTRIAGGSEAMWKDIFGTNSGALAAATRKLARDFQALADSLEGEQPRVDLALELLERARRRSQ